MDKPLLNPGDVVFTAGRSWLSRAIRWAERSRGEELSKVNHAALVCVPGGTVPNTWIVESDWTVRYARIGTHHAKDSVFVFRPVDMTAEQIREVCLAALRRIGERYAVAQLFPQLLDNKLFGGRVIFRRLSKLDRRAICSRLVCEAFQKVGLDFGVPSYAADPDTMFDFCENNPDHYRLVWAGVPGESGETE